MFGRKAAVFGFALILVLVGCVLIDSWFMEDGYIDPDGEGPEAPIPTFEIAAKRDQIEFHVDAMPPLPIPLEASTQSIAAPHPTEIAFEPTCPRPVDPAGWLGRRHFRSPT
jgi:hypothetical protein